MKIEVLGTGCSKCAQLFENTKKAVAKESIFAQIEKVQDIQNIMNYGVMSLPAIVVDGVVKSSGKMLNPEEIAKLLKS